MGRKLAQEVLREKGFWWRLDVLLLEFDVWYWYGIGGGV
jgi:hypothetical protein